MTDAWRPGHSRSALPAPPRPRETSHESFRSRPVRPAPAVAAAGALVAPGDDPPNGVAAVLKPFVDCGTRAGAVGQKYDGKLVKATGRAATFVPGPPTTAMKGPPSGSATGKRVYGPDDGTIKIVEAATSWAGTADLDDASPSAG